MRRDSRSTTSTTRGSLSHLAAHDSANVDGSTSSSSIAQPSAFETIFEVTTTTSPSSNGAPDTEDLQRHPSVADRLEELDDRRVHRARVREVGGVRTADLDHGPRARQSIR